MKKDKGITLSPKHGLNPSLLKCFACGEDAGIAILGKLKGDEEAPKEMVQRGFFCEKCQSVIDQDGLLVVAVRDGETGDNPYRTGRMVGITKDAKEKVFKDFQGNFAYMEETMFNQMFDTK